MPNPVGDHDQSRIAGHLAVPHGSRSADPSPPGGGPPGLRTVPSQVPDQGRFARSDRGRSGVASGLCEFEPAAVPAESAVSGGGPIRAAPGKGTVSLISRGQSPFPDPVGPLPKRGQSPSNSRVLSPFRQRFSRESWQVFSHLLICMRMTTVADSWGLPAGGGGQRPGTHRLEHPMKEGKRKN